MLKALITCCLIGCLQMTFAQSTPANAGQELNHTNGSINFTIGEPIIESLHSSNSSLLQGFHQPTLSIKPNSINGLTVWELHVFPNPAQNLIHVEWNNALNTHLQYTLLDMNGKMVLQGKSEEHFSIDVNHLAAASYLLVLTDPQNQTQTFNIQKIQ